MSLKDKIFSRFVKAKGLGLGANFVSKARGYTDDRGVLRTREQLMSSQEYAGFVDGIQGNPHHYDGPKGSLKPKSSLRQDLTTKLFDSARMLSGNEEVVSGMVRDALATTPLGYDDGYRLGSSLRGTLE